MVTCDDCGEEFERSEIYSDDSGNYCDEDRNNWLDQQAAFYYALRAASRPRVVDESLAYDRGNYKDPRYIESLLD